MTRLLDDIRVALTARRTRSDSWMGASSFNDFLGIIGQFGFGGHQYPYGMTQTLTGNREEIDSGFAGLIQGAYRSNGIVFACELARFMLFSEARFQFQQMSGGRPGELFGTPDLAILERPWPGGVTGDLLTRALVSADFAGDAFIVRRRDGRGRLRFVRRPDWMTFVLGVRDVGTIDSGDLDADLLGYLYHPGGHAAGKPPEVLAPDEVAHFAPVPDPLASYRGMPWLTPVIREIQGDSAATSHKLRFFENGATPNMVVSLDSAIPPSQFTDWIKLFKSKEPVGRDVYKTLYLGGGATVQLVGSDLKQLDFKSVQGAGETRIAAAAGVPPVIAGFSEGLQAATYSNYSQARRRFVDGTIRPLWRNMAGSLETIVPPPSGSRLWYDDRDIAFLREDAKDRAEIQGLESRTIRTLVDAGYLPDSVRAAVMAEDWSRLSHSGLYSVQLQPPQPDGQPGDTGRALAQLVAPHLAGLISSHANGDKP